MFARAEISAALKLIKIRRAPQRGAVHRAFCLLVVVSVTRQYVKRAAAAAHSLKRRKRRVLSPAHRDKPTSAALMAAVGSVILACVISRSCQGAAISRVRSDVINMISPCPPGSWSFLLPIANILLDIYFCFSGGFPPLAGLTVLPDDMSVPQIDASVLQADASVYQTDMSVPPGGPAVLPFDPRGLPFDPAVRPFGSATLTFDPDECPDGTPVCLRGPSVHPGVASVRPGGTKSTPPKAFLRENVTGLCENHAEKHISDAGCTYDGG